jgi:hypothetical protein
VRWFVYNESLEAVRVEIRIEFYSTLEKISLLENVSEIGKETQVVYQKMICSQFLG